MLQLARTWCARATTCPHSRAQARVAWCASARSALAAAADRAPRAPARREVAGARLEPPRRDGSRGKSWRPRQVHARPGPRTRAQCRPRAHSAAQTHRAPARWSLTSHTLPHRTIACTVVLRNQASELEQAAATLLAIVAVIAGSLLHYTRRGACARRAGARALGWDGRASSLRPHPLRTKRCSAASGTTISWRAAPCAPAAPVSEALPEDDRPRPRRPSRSPPALPRRAENGRLSA